MIDYTRAAIEKTVSDFKRFGFIFNIVIEALSISYLVYAMIVGAGIIYLNISLTVLSLAYLAFYTKVGLDPEKRKLYTSTKTGYKALKITVYTVNLGITVYGIYIATEELSFVTIVMAAATTIGWAINMLVTFLVSYLSSKASFLIRAIEADIAEAKRPVEKVDNFIKRLRGEEIKPKDPPDKTGVLLEKTVTEFREKKRAEKERRKEERRQRIKGIFSKEKNREDIVIDPDGQESEE